MNEEKTLPTPPAPGVSTAATAVSAHWGFHPMGMLAVVIAVPAVATVFWWLGTGFFDSRLGLAAYLEYAVILSMVVTGGYQIYFWAQRNGRHRPARSLKIAFDDRIPFWPRWVWIYTVLYYAMIGMTVVVVRDAADGIHLIFGGLVVLGVGSVVFYFFPTYVPEDFRSFEVTGLSTRFLAFVQSMDSNRNAFPSMHCAITTYVGLTLSAIPVFGPYIGVAYIVLVTVSCLVVKQHVVVDCLAGIVLGALGFVASTQLWGIP